MDESEFLNEWAELRAKSERAGERIETASLDKGEERKGKRNKDPTTRELDER